MIIWRMYKQKLWRSIIYLDISITKLKNSEKMNKIMMINKKQEKVRGKFQVKQTFKKQNFEEVDFKWKIKIISKRQK